MVKLIPNMPEDVLAFDIIGEYRIKDVKILERLFLNKTRNHKKVNILAKIDHLDLSKTTLKAFWEDFTFALQYYKDIKKIAIVGNNDFQKYIIKLDSWFFDNEKHGRVEKYFDVKEIKDARTFVSKEVVTA